MRRRLADGSDRETTTVAGIRGEKRRQSAQRRRTRINISPHAVARHARHIPFVPVTSSPVVHMVFDGKAHRGPAFIPPWYRPPHRRLLSHPTVLAPQPAIIPHPYRSAPPSPHRRRGADTPAGDGDREARRRPKNRNSSTQFWGRQEHVK